MKFIGIDLGWTTGPTGLCSLQFQTQTLQIIDITRITEIENILTWIDTQTPTPEPAIIAVDAPTLIFNQTGMRQPDKLAHKHFGKYHAGCYPANLNRPFATRTIALGIALETRGFIHAPTIEPQKTGRYQIEVYPHPAIINLFQLNKILKYKKGNLEERKKELTKLQSHVLETLPKIEPKLDLTPTQKTQEIFSDLTKLTGQKLKAIEDQLDSLICAYIAAHWWYWGHQKNLVLGDQTTGYIIIPTIKNPPQ
jgi:predicted RNase H-like nuclease